MPLEVYKRLFVQSCSPFPLFSNQNINYMPNPDLTVNQVKEKAATLKAIIEGALKTFKEETGYLPQVAIETKEHRTNDKDFSTQKVTVTVQM